MTESEKLATGFIKTYRSVMERSWYTKPGFFHLYQHLHLKASHSGFETWFAGKTVMLKPGQLVTGRKKLSQEIGIDENKIERILKTFQNEQIIEQQTSNTSRLISILEWALYQKGEQQNEQQVNNDRTTDEQQVNTIQEGKEGINNDKNEKREANGLSSPEKNSFNEREKKFLTDLLPFVETYGKDMIQMFYDYWREPNRSKTRMRWEQQKTWELSLRLKTWNNNEQRFNKNPNLQDGSSIVTQKKLDEWRRQKNEAIMNGEFFEKRMAL